MKDISIQLYKIVIIFKSLAFIITILMKVKVRVVKMFMNMKTLLKLSDI